MSGSDASGLNLDAVRTRAVELRGSLLEVVGTLRDSPHLLHWDNVLKKFATINLQMMSVREQLRAILRQVVVHPKMVTDPNLAQALPLQLASSELPEMQAADAELVAMEETMLREAGIPPADHFEAADSQIEDFNNLLTDLTSGPEALFCSKGPARVQVMLRSKKIAKAAASSRAATAATVATGEGGNGAAFAAAAGGGASGAARALAGAKKQKIVAAGQKAGAAPPSPWTPP